MKKFATILIALFIAVAVFWLPWMDQSCHRTPAIVQQSCHYGYPSLPRTGQFKVERFEYRP